MDFKLEKQSVPIEVPKRSKKKKTSSFIVKDRTKELVSIKKIDEKQIVFEYGLDDFRTFIYCPYHIDDKDNKLVTRFLNTHVKHGLYSLYHIRQVASKMFPIVAEYGYLAMQNK